MDKTTMNKWIKDAEKSKNFDSYKLYKVRIWNDEEEFYKIGITFLTLNKSLTSIKLFGYECEVVEVIQSQNGEYIYKLEGLLKSLHRAGFNMYIPKKPIKGYMSCYRKLLKL